MRRKIENILFNKYSFWGPFGIVFLLGIPWWIAFWPGTLQYDSCGQLLQYLGVGRMTGHHPLPVTMIMGIFLDIGRLVFHSDNAGIFLYTGSQFFTQCVILAYVFCVYQKNKVPNWVRWVTLVFYAVFPLVPNWGISYCKDTGYYISFLLLALVIFDTFYMENASITIGKMSLLIASMLGIVSFRNDGRYVLFLSAIAMLIVYKKYRKQIILGVSVAGIFIILIECVYMPLRGIPSGSIREALSVPLMQTAKYIGEYGEEITQEEETILLTVFEVESLERVSMAYDKDISDRVKDLFKEDPKKEELTAYFKVWWKQFLKHPDSYIRTYWEHSRGYFHPIEEPYDDVIGWFKILDGQQRSDEYLDIYFAAEDPTLRNVLETWCYDLYQFPIIRVLFRPAFHTLVMFGSLVFLLIKQRKKAISVIIPGIVVLLICTVSPLNASIRYYLAVMVTTPIYMALCCVSKD